MYFYGLCFYFVVDVFFYTIYTFIDKWCFYKPNQVFELSRILEKLLYVLFQSIFAYFSLQGLLDRSTILSVFLTHYVWDTKICIVYNKVMPKSVFWGIISHHICTIFILILFIILTELEVFKTDNFTYTLIIIWDMISFLFYASKFHKYLFQHKLNIKTYNYWYYYILVTTFVCKFGGQFIIYFVLWYFVENTYFTSVSYCIVCCFSMNLLDAYRLLGVIQKQRDKTFI